MSTLPLAARRALIPLAAAAAFGCRDTTAPTPGGAPAPGGAAVVPAAVHGDPIPPADRTTFITAVVERFRGTTQESSANALAAAAYPAPSPTVGTKPSCEAAEQLAALVLQAYAADNLRGQTNNPPLSPAADVIADVGTIVATALAVACAEHTPPQLTDALTGGGAAAFMFAATGGTLKARNGKAAAHNTREL